MVLLQVEPTRGDAVNDRDTAAIDPGTDVACRQARWIESTLHSLSCLRTYPRDKIGVSVDRSGATTLIRLQLPHQLDPAGLAEACRWTRRAALDFDPSRPVHLEIVEHSNRSALLG